MASGTPDYHTPVDLALQSLAEVTARNTYGAAQKSAFSQAAIPAGTTVTLITITGTGYIYGGDYVAAPSPNIDNSEGFFTMIIDGVTITFPFWKDIILFNYTAPAPFMLSVTSIDGPNDEITGYLPGSLTFESSFVLKYTADASGIEGATGNLIYATT